MKGKQCPAFQVDLYGVGGTYILGCEEDAELPSLGQYRAAALRTWSWSATRENDYQSRNCRAEIALVLLTSYLLPEKHPVGGTLAQIKEGFSPWTKAFRFGLCPCRRPNWADDPQRAALIRVSTRQSHRPGFKVKSSGELGRSSISQQRFLSRVCSTGGACTFTKVLSPDCQPMRTFSSLTMPGSPTKGRPSPLVAAYSR